MRYRRGYRPIGLRLSATACATIALLFVASAWWSVCWCGKRGPFIGVRSGRVFVAGDHKYTWGFRAERHQDGLRGALSGPKSHGLAAMLAAAPRGGMLTIGMTSLIANPFGMGLSEFSGGPYSIPLWIPFAALAAPTGMVCILGRRRPKPGHCRRCGYNLTGNTSGICPECGEPTATSAPTA